MPLCCWGMVWLELLRWWLRRCGKMGKNQNDLGELLLMEEILHHLEWLKPYKLWDNHHPWWCRILSINSILGNLFQSFFFLFKVFCWVIFVSSCYMLGNYFFSGFFGSVFFQKSLGISGVPRWDHRWIWFISRNGGIWAMKKTMIIFCR